MQLYKDYFKKVAERVHIRPDEYAKLLRDTTSISDKNTFMNCAREIFSAFCSDKDMVEESTARLWRFVNDYAWWSGQKTIDRGDFYLSVILNMLNLVNASQSYVGDIVSAYANDHTLARLGWFCPVVSEPVKPYFTRFLRVLTFCLGASKIVIFC